MSKKIEIKLTPQNEEWIKLIPNPSQNIDIIFNKLIEISINDGLLLKIISQSLTVNDLSKFKTVYLKMQSKRTEYMTALEEITPNFIIKNKNIYSQVNKDIQDEKILSESNEIKEKKISRTDEPSKKVSHGFDEDTF